MLRKTKMYSVDLVHRKGLKTHENILHKVLRRSESLKMHIKWSNAAKAVPSKLSPAFIGHVKDWPNPAETQEIGDFVAPSIDFEFREINSVLLEMTKFNLHFVTKMSMRQLLETRVWN